MLPASDRPHASKNVSPGCTTVDLGGSYSGERGADPAPDSKMALFGKDEYVAVALGETLSVFSFNSVHSGQGAALGDAVARIEIDRVTLLQASGRRNPFELTAVLADNTVWALELRDPETGSPRLESRRLCDPIDGDVRNLVCTRTKAFVMTDSRGGQFSSLVEVDPYGSEVTREANLPFSPVVSLSSFDPHQGDDLVAVDALGDAHLVAFGSDRGSTHLDTTPFTGLSRVTAATVVGDSMVVARKGGELLKSRYALERGDQRTAFVNSCRRLRRLLEACGCEDPCRHQGGVDRPETDTGTVRPGGTGGAGGPAKEPGGIVDDEPCSEKQNANLGWSVGALSRAGGYLVAVSNRKDRMAILDESLNVVSERYLGRKGASVIPGSTTTDHILVHRPGGATAETWSIGQYAKDARGIPPEIKWPLKGATTPTSVCFHGRKHRPAAPNPELKIAVFPVTEPGQAFNDPDQSKMHSLLQTNVYDVVTDYHLENSFQQLETKFTVFGVDLGAARRPLVLPRSFASYFYDEYRSGGVEAVMPADWSNPLALDGTELLKIRTDPAAGSGADYVVDFAALWTSRNHPNYPIAVAFNGSEVLQMDAVDQTGTSLTLNLDFGPLNLNHAQGDDEAAFLSAIGSHVTSAVRAAEAALPGSPKIVQDVQFRRIRINDDDSQFGELQGQFRIAPPSNAAAATGKGKVTIVPPGTPFAALSALGIDGSSAIAGNPASGAQLVSYWRECLAATQADAGEGPGSNDPHFLTTVTAVEDPVAKKITVGIQLTDAKGGAGASIQVVQHTGLTGSGWNNATPVMGSTSSYNNRNTMRDWVDLSDDVFTAAMDHIRATSVWDQEAVRAQFADFDAMMIGFVGECPPTVPAADRWSSASPAGFNKRMFVRYHQATDRHNPDPNRAPVTMGTELLIGQRFDSFDPGVMSHEVGHGLSLPDLYGATGFRDDVLYVDDWCQMAGSNDRFNHFCAWSKWSVGWIVDDPGNPAINRVVDVPMPAPSGTSVTEAWLVPVEHWDASMKADVVAAVGNTLPIGQMMKVHLGSDGGVLDLIELRSRGVSFSQQLPPTPAVIVTNVMQFDMDRRWAVNGLYRRHVHMLNNGNELRSVGDTWDFAANQEFPLKGCRVEIVDLQSIRGGSIPICRVRVEREPAEFIDLHFQDNVPSWRSPDIWIDWPGDNADPSVPRMYPEGTPTDQGEVVRFPATGVEPHFLVTRVHNAGNVRAEDVKVRWFVCDPPGAGDEGRWVQVETETIPQIQGNDWEAVPFIWEINPSTNVHQCLRAEIIDWTIPDGVDPATGDTVALSSDDVRLQNNIAQKNVFDFEALSGSPYDQIEFDFQVHNDATVTETAYLCPKWLPWGTSLEVSPSKAEIAPNEAAVFRCKLTLDDQIIRPGCSNDQGFLLTAWRVAEDADQPWGSCFYYLRPRLKTKVEIERGNWYGGTLSAYGVLKIVAAESKKLADHLPLSVRIRILLIDSEGAEGSRWEIAAIQPDGTFKLNIPEFEGVEGLTAQIQAWFDRTPTLGSSISPPKDFVYQPEVILK